MDVNRRVPADRESVRGAVVVRNSLVTAVGRSGTSLRLSAPVASGGFRWLLKREREKAFELDGLGMWVWDRVDGRVTVGELVEVFAATHEVGVAEAEGRVMVFLRVLLQRNLVTLVKK